MGLNIWADGPEHLTEFPMALFDAVMTAGSLLSEKGSETADRGLDPRGPHVGGGGRSESMDCQAIDTVSMRASQIDATRCTLRGD